MRKGGVGMARAREEQEVRSALDSIQELLADGSQALIEGAQSVQRLLLATGRGVEGQVSLLLGTLESTLGGQLDALLGRFSASIRTEVDRTSEPGHRWRDPQKCSTASSASSNAFHP